MPVRAHARESAKRCAQMGTLVSILIKLEIILKGNSRIHYKRKEKVRHIFKWNSKRFEIEKRERSIYENVMKFAK